MVGSRCLLAIVLFLFLAAAGVAVAAAASGAEPPRKVIIGAADEIPTTAEEPLPQRFLLSGRTPGLAPPPATILSGSSAAASGQAPATPAAAATARARRASVAEVPAARVRTDKAAADRQVDAAHSSTGEAKPAPPRIALPTPASVARCITFADEAALREAVVAPAAPAAPAAPEQPSGAASGFVEPAGDYTTLEDGLDQQLAAAGVGTAVVSPWRGTAAALFILGLILLLYGGVKWLRPKPLFKLAANAQVVADFAISPGKRVVLARILDRHYLLGLTREGITLLDRVDYGEVQGNGETSLSAPPPEARPSVGERVLARARPLKLRTSEWNRDAGAAPAATYSPYRNRPGEAKAPRETPASRRPAAASRVAGNHDGRKEYLLSRLQDELARLG